MAPNHRRLSWLVWAGLAFVLLVIVAAFVSQQLQKTGLADLGPLRVISQVPSFTLTNQMGRQVGLADLQGKVWVADIIFTRCPGPCVQMTRRMRELQDALPADVPVQFLSLTTDPDFDTPDVLRDYGKRFGAQDSRWWFLTGQKPEIKRLAVEGLKLVMMEKAEADQEAPNDLFLHSTLLVVVDAAGQVRAVFETLPRTADEDQGAESAEETEAAWRQTREQLVRTVLFLARGDRVFTVRDLPALNACLNGLSTVWLVAGFVMIRRGNKAAHQRCMLAAVVTSVLFLISYLTYHAAAGHTSFRDPAWFRPYYLGLLASHVLLAAAIVPLVLLTLSRAWRERFEAHKRLARWTWPLWVYVSVTGVLIYLILYWICPQFP